MLRIYPTGRKVYTIKCRVGRVQSIHTIGETRGQGHAVGVRKVFERVCKDALENLRIHDLRHSFASFAVADGASLFLIGKLLGHASVLTTERYAHLSVDPLQEAVSAIGRTIAGGSDG